MDISFTTTAMPRPEILERTYSSFTSKIINIDFKMTKLYINIDPFPDNQVNNIRDQCIDVAKKYFGDVISNKPDKPGFCQAVKWVWSQPSSEYIFHLEDDWELEATIDINKLVSLYKECMPQVVIRPWRSSMCSFYLSPHIMRKKIYQWIASKLDISKNPEEYIRRLLIAYRPMGVRPFGVPFPRDRSRVIVKDLGRNWLKDKNYVRGDANFVEWQTKNENNSNSNINLRDQTKQ